MNDATVLRGITMACATIMVIAGACVATAAVRRETRRWWAVVGTLAVAALIVWVGYSLFHSGYYFAYSPQ